MQIYPFYFLLPTSSSHLTSFFLSFSKQRKKFNQFSDLKHTEKLVSHSSLWITTCIVIATVVKLQEAKVSLSNSNYIF